MSCAGLLVGSVTRTTRFVVGTNSRTISILFAVNPETGQAAPVRLPPGRFRLLTRPVATGSSARTMIGTVFGTVLGAKAALFEYARTAAPFLLTSSAACLSI